MFSEFQRCTLNKKDRVLKSHFSLVFNWLRFREDRNQDRNQDEKSLMGWKAHKLGIVHYRQLWPQACPFNVLIPGFLI